MSELDDLIMQTICPRCGAVGGEGCFTASGRASRFTHSKRGEVVVAAWLYGRLQMLSMLTLGNFGPTERDEA